MSRVKTYSPKEVSIAWYGIQFSGLGEDTMVSITRNSDNSTPTVGAQGVIQHVKSADLTGTLEVTLLQNSETNIYLTNIQLLQDNSPDLFFGNMTVTDPSGGQLWDCRDAHLMKSADCVLGSGHNAKTYTFYIDECVAVGANSEIATALGVASRVNAAAGLFG